MIDAPIGWKRLRVQLIFHTTTSHFNFPPHVTSGCCNRSIKGLIGERIYTKQLSRKNFLQYFKTPFCWAGLFRLAVRLDVLIAMGALENAFFFSKGQRSKANTGFQSL